MKRWLFWIGCAEVFNQIFRFFGGMGLKINLLWNFWYFISIFWNWVISFFWRASACLLENIWRQLWNNLFMWTYCSWFWRLQFWSCRWHWRRIFIMESLWKLNQKIITLNSSWSNWSLHIVKFSLWLQWFLNCFLVNLDRFLSILWLFCIRSKNSLLLIVHSI